MMVRIFVWSKACDHFAILYLILTIFWREMKYSNTKMIELQLQIKTFVALNSKCVIWSTLHLYENAKSVVRTHGACQPY